MKAWFEAWWATASVWEALKFWVPTALSIIALAYVLYDRRPHLALKARKGDWYILDLVDTPKGKRLMCRGVIEIYNMSGRANAVKGFEASYKSKSGGWHLMDCERYEDTKVGGTTPKIFNHTPLTLPPYSGAEAQIMAFTPSFQKPVELEIKIIVEDLFGKKSSVVFTAIS